jgi:hypothetical protein
MHDPHAWTIEDLTNDAAEARELFRRERLDEPLALYSEFFDSFSPIFHAIISKLPKFTQHEVDAELMAELVADANARTAFRYLAAPPISEDDLKTLADAKLSKSALLKNPDQAARVRDTVLQILDHHRFPWVKEGRKPVGHERVTAVVASAAMIAAKKVETKRRKDAKDKQEERVKRLLRDLMFDEVPRRNMPLLKDAPEPGQFCGESKLGDTRADLVVGLHDRRVMPVECKVSNSEVNSFKRVNHEAAGKARTWLNLFGRKGTVPAAVLSGVFKPANLKTAQAEGLSLFWGHRLSDLADFIKATKS